MERTASDSLPPAPPLTAAFGRPFFHGRADRHGHDDAVLGDAERLPGCADRSEAPFGWRHGCRATRLHSDHDVCFLAAFIQNRYCQNAEFRLPDELVHRHDRQHYSQHEDEHDRSHHHDQRGLQQRSKPRQAALCIALQLLGGTLEHRS